jgi:probable rRNA maturation factor
MIRVHVHTGEWEVDDGLLSRAAEAALRARGVHAAELSVTLLDDADIRELNAGHLGRDRVTDVISFALGEAGGAGLVGDVYLGAAQADRQALEAGIGLREELVRLAVHGALHATGMEHPEEAEERTRSEMYRLQERLVADLLGDAPDDAAAGRGEGG